MLSIISMISLVACSSSTQSSQSSDSNAKENIRTITDAVGNKVEIKGEVKKIGVAPIMLKNSNMDELTSSLTVVGELLNKEEKAQSFIDCYKDIYNEGAFFLDVYNEEASKANGIKFLADYVEHSKVITFGDGENDIPMFKISDECYALENSSQELKSISTGVIGNNNDDAVVKFLIERLKIEKI